jgi:hypothetical protein
MLDRDVAHTLIPKSRIPCQRLEEQGYFGLEDICGTYRIIVRTMCAVSSCRIRDFVNLGEQEWWRSTIDMRKGRGLVCLSWSQATCCNSRSNTHQLRAKHFFNLNSQKVYTCVHVDETIYCLSIFVKTTPQRLNCQTEYRYMEHVYDLSVDFCKRKSCVWSTTLHFIVGVGCLWLMIGQSPFMPERAQATSPSMAAYCV